MPCVPWIHPLSIISKLSMPAAVEKKWKPQNGHRPCAPCTPRAPKNSDTPQTSAINNPRTVRDQLTLHDWLSVMSYSILTPINPFHKKKSLNTLQAGLMGLWNSCNLPFLNTCQRKDMRRISHGLQQTQQPYQGKGLGLSHTRMLRRHLFCGWNTWERSCSMLWERCWLQSGPSLKTY